MTIYVVCMKHKRTVNYIEPIEMFLSEKNAYKFKAKFNENRPSYSMAEIISFEFKDVSKLKIPKELKMKEVNDECIERNS